MKYAILIKCRWNDHQWIYPILYDHEPTEKEIAQVMAGIETNNTCEILKTAK